LDVGDRVGDFVGEGIDGDAEGTVDGDAGVGVAINHEEGENGFIGVADGGGEGFDDVCGIGGYGGLDEDDDNGVDVCLSADDVEGLLVGMMIGGGEHVNGVGAGGFGGQDFFEFVLGVIGEVREGAVGVFEGVGGEDGGTTTVGDDGDAAHGAGRHDGHGQGGVEHFLHVFAADGGGLFEEGIDDDIGGGEGAGVGGGGAAGDVAAA